MPPSLRIALRSLRRAPGFTAVVVLTLAIGIGATTAIFSVVDAVLINPLPYPTAERLEMIWVTNPQQARDKDVTSYPNFTDWQSQATTFEAMAAVFGANFTLTGAGEPRLIPGERVTGRFFDLFGMPALHGRTASGGGHAARTRVGARSQPRALARALRRRRRRDRPHRLGQCAAVRDRGRDASRIQRDPHGAGVGTAFAIGAVRATRRGPRPPMARSDRPGEARHASRIGLAWLTGCRSFASRL